MSSFNAASLIAELKANPVLLLELKTLLETAVAPSDPAPAAAPAAPVKKPRAPRKPKVVETTPAEAAALVPADVPEAAAAEAAPAAAEPKKRGRKPKTTVAAEPTATTAALDALAMATTPGRSKRMVRTISSSNSLPQMDSPTVPSPAGSPVWIMNSLITRWAAAPEPAAEAAAPAPAAEPKKRGRKPKTTAVVAEAATGTAAAEAAVPAPAEEAAVPEAAAAAEKPKKPRAPRKPKAAAAATSAAEESVAAAEEPKTVEWITFLHLGHPRIRNVKTGNVYQVDDTKGTLEEMVLRDKYEGRWIDGALNEFAEEEL